MQLEKLAAVVRPRTHLEAVDLGFSMVREWWRPVFGAWAVTFLPVAVLATLVSARSPGWALLVLWWLRPLLDRIPLFVLSRALFGATPTRAEVVRELPRLLRGHLFQALVLFRLDPSRSFNLPVWELEGLRGTARWKRSTVLQGDGHGVGMSLTAACSTMEAALVFGLLGLFAMLIPRVGLEEVLEAMGRAFDDKGSYGQGAGFLTAFFLAFFLVEPFFVAGGFTLYLNRRTRLEGWDVELAFKRLARRLSASAGAALPRTALLVLGLGLGLGLSSSTALAQSPPVPEEAPQAGTGAEAGSPGESIERILATPEFETRKKITRWRLKWDRQGKTDTRPPFSFGGPALRLFLQVLFFTFLALLVAWGVRELLRRRVTSPDESPAGPSPVRDASRRTPGKESLPADVPAAALALWDAGERERALGLLYRASLAFLASRLLLQVRDADTEGECLAQVRKRSPGPRADALEKLVLAWQQAAFAHHAPSRELFLELLSLWRRSFGEAA